MGYHPETMVCSFPPYPRRRGSKLGEREPWRLGGAFYALKPWIGFDVWHIDPEKPGTGNRTDDSCGWFDRTPGDYAEAVDYLLNDTSTVHEVQMIMERQVWVRSAYQPEPGEEGYGGRLRGYERLSSADALALCMLIARELEIRRWWNTGRRPAHSHLLSRWLRRRRDVMPTAHDLALNPIDNLTTVESPESAIRCVASALNRRFRPWWKHPRWHVHHWQINFDLTRNLRRMFEPCATCRKPLGFGYSPFSDHRGLHHLDCAGIGVAACAAE